jgi:hypothetical protein
MFLQALLAYRKRTIFGVLGRCMMSPIWTKLLLSRFAVKMMMQQYVESGMTVLKKYFLSIQILALLRTCTRWQRKDLFCCCQFFYSLWQQRDDFHTCILS